MPFACAAASPSAMRAAIVTASRHGMGPRAKRILRAFAFEQLDDGDGFAVDDGQLVNRHHVFMRERRDGTRFVFESSPHFGIAREVGGQDLQRDVAPEPGIVRTVHFAHAAGTNECLHFVLRDSRTWNE